ncbi:MAG: hypothetical protein U0996_14415 [Planctomycetaceae bacterium]
MRRLRFVRSINMPMLRIVQRVVSGIVGGACVGVLIGAYFAVRTADQVVLRSDFGTSLPMVYEEATSRYQWAVCMSFAATFAAIGPFLTHARFGNWLRPAVYGLISAMMILCLSTYAVSAFTRKQPYFTHKGAGRECIDAAIRVGIPMVVVFGPVIGILVSRSSRVAIQNGSSQQTP